MKHRRAMRRWLIGAWPLLMTVMEAEDALISGSEGPAVTVRALCDQLDAAARHAHGWSSDHRCPDERLDRYVGELISASQGMCAIMQLVSEEAPEGEWMDDPELTDRVGNNLLDRIEQASRARHYLRRWVP